MPDRDTRLQGMASLDECYGGGDGGGYGDGDGKMAAARVVVDDEGWRSRRCSVVFLVLAPS